MLEIEQRLPGLLHTFIGLGPVQLVEINAVGLETFERAFHFLQNGGAGGKPVGRAILVGQHAALGGHRHRLAPFLDGFANDLLGQAEAVSVRGIDPVYAGLERLEDGGDRVGLILRPPAHAPVVSTNSPRA